MDSESWERMREALLRAQDLSGAARSEYLAQLRSESPDLADEVESLLAQRTRDELASGGLTEVLGAALNDRDDAPVTGRRLGPYHLGMLLGTGGMGAVYRAVQEEPIRRDVAIKLLRGGLDPAKILSRFEAERRALSLADHPGIARILDAGADEAGTPYLVMELVRGVPITEYCRSHHASPHDVLSLIVSICRAVQHAHQRGVIHRDIKPSNLLIAEVDGTPVPKIIDFGIARVIDEEGRPHTLFTTEGQIVGTVGYMSPEQAAGRGREVDTRTDVYSLGVVLYELLTGELPHDLEGQSLPEAIHTIRRTPARPFRHTGNHRLDGDIETIVMKCLEADPARRYDGPGAIADDIERFKRSEPIMARPPSTAYQLRTLVRRHRTGMAFGATAVLVLIAFGVTMSVLYAGQRRDRERARTEGARAEAVSRFLEEMLASASPGMLGRNVTVREVMDQSLETLSSSFDGEPATLASIQATLGSSYADLGLLERADSLHREALAIRRALYGERNADVAASIQALAEVAVAMRRLPEADSLCRIALAVRESVLGEETREVANSLRLLGTLQGKLGHLMAADTTLRRCVALSGRVFGDGSAELAYAHVAHGAVLTALGRNGAAESEYRQGVRILERRLGPDHPRTIESSLLLAEVLRFLARTAEAESIATRGVERSARVYGTEHFRHADALRTLGEAQVANGHLDDGERNLTRAVAIYRRSAGESNPMLRPAYMELGNIRANRGDNEGAERLYRLSIAVAERLQAPDHPGRQASMSALAHSYVGRGRIDDAIHVFSEMQEALLHAADGDDGRAVMLDDRLGTLLLHRGRTAEAERHFRSAGPDDAPALFGLGVCLGRRGDFGTADSLIERALPAVLAMDRVDFRRLFLLEAAEEYYRGRGISFRTGDPEIP